MPELAPTATKNRSVIPLLALLIVAGLAGFYLPKWLSSSSPFAQLPAAPSQYCALSTKSCQQQGITITLDTDIAQPLKESQIQVNWPHNNSDSLILTLRGLEMDLGIVKFPLSKQQNGLYEGSVILPICTDAQMTWIGTITDQDGHHVYTSIRMEK